MSGVTWAERAVLGALKELDDEIPGRHWRTLWVESSTPGPNRPSHGQYPRLLAALEAEGYAESGWPGAARRTVWKITPAGRARLAADAEVPPSWVTS